jgi:gamma-glutamyl:cysteine ligase YbdK (ATP-grasp superfamily)
LSSDDQIDNAFGSGEPFSVGIEEELFLVDPISGRQANASSAVQERLGPVHGAIERELHACQMELITDICHSANEAASQLRGLRRAVLETGAGLLGSGTHPSAIEGEAEITDKERYERIQELLGDAVATPRAANVPDYTWFCWKMRPHPRLGTVEVRALDAQASLEDTAGLVALTHCLARHAAETGPEPDPPAEVLDEGVFRAARFGVSARLPDAQGRLRPVDELLQEALALARRYANDLHCTDQLDTLRALLERGGGAGRQRASYQIAGMDALLRDLTELTRGQPAQAAAR